MYDGVLCHSDLAISSVKRYSPENVHAGMAFERSLPSDPLPITFASAATLYCTGCNHTTTWCLLYGSDTRTIDKLSTM
ncbi:hypothetical protein BDV93DRAFT_526783 [Ceratobasidium sp. AG-I]|nr:hypothetical protein BDV93DRAFT_526783 [Ceratobasidium sp. AG-I]